MNAKMSHATFQIIYDGPALENSTMDVKDLAPALLALGEAIEQANFSTNHQKASVVLNVRASFKTGCFGIEFDVVQSLLEQTKSLFESNGISSAKEIVETLGFVGGSITASYRGLIGLMRHLKGREIQEITPLKEGNFKFVVDGESFEVDAKVVSLYRNTLLRKAIQKAITDQLEKDGIDSVAFLNTDNKTFNVIEKIERQWFAADNNENVISENELTMVLMIESPSFKKANKWKFSAGGNSFFASINDLVFLDKVDSGQELFGKGDYLTSVVSAKQLMTDSGLKMEYVILKVISHDRKPSQASIF